MKTNLILVATLSFLATPVFAHRLDEYLQAMIVSVRQNEIKASMRLIPGVAVSNAVISAIDLNGDGVFSRAEQQTYARQVLRDVSFALDGRALQPRLLEVNFPAPADVKGGLAEIHIEFAADLPPGESHRSLVIENHHEPRMSVYLMNCLVPQDRAIQVMAQSRNQNQSYYRVDYVQSAIQELPRWRSDLAIAVAPFAGVPEMFRLGIRHISEGTDHLLFLITLLLPAPLVARRLRWDASGGVRRSLVHILRVVTAFTVGHSITLALGASGLVSLPERPVEVLIAFSILISAVHALRPLFPGREPMIAASFGLIHGLAFAATLQNLGVGPWQRLASILGFNLGIETMQLAVVGSILPSLLILSRTSAYLAFRVIGALFAGFASIGWILERLFGVADVVSIVADSVAQRAAWITGSLFVISIVSWLWREMHAQPAIVSEDPTHPTLEGI